MSVVFKAHIVKYLSNFGEMEQRSMFGGTGFFYDGAMFMLLTDKRLYLRGGGALSERLLDKTCRKFVHVKKSSTAVVNYYEITSLYIQDDPELGQLVKTSIDIAVADKKRKESLESRRLRDLPNLRLTIERMLKKSGVEDVRTFNQLTPEELFRRVQMTHGKDVDVSLLWKFAGAQQGCHWKLIEKEERDRLLAAV
ncbi:MULTISPECIES: TfoX/Sxy family DNA transformation protein [Salinivibrio]|uniref:TfoX/Sxy family DNA transformation protein n=1 Tax=Salinivibrio TaxID=51366 RepID=UPI00098751D5|nr:MULTISPECIES: TfoX/Sxy family DNA transformation protein [Salinivibrio]OOF08549.1 DNA transformation protein [Salinivibrio sp. PR5]OOF15871.1 DNA transformation protein [Salinivibrio sp. PR919]OOF16168.1 DNA transformation protein [Salinivibrio sp. PR932]OOF31644.1 DNA transformation protein [Salinivibrio proteolyticus]